MSDIKGLIIRPAIGYGRMTDIGQGQQIPLLLLCSDSF